MLQQAIVPSERETCGVESLLHSLGLFSQVANAPPMDIHALARFEKRELAFDWTHMGNSEIRIGELVDVLQGHETLSPPRTGHMGNWSNIIHGRAGSHDYNNLTCGPHRIGHALIFDLNQTESDTPGLGDWSYLPGSKVDRCERKILALSTWDGTNFRRRDRSAPLFVPFALAEIDGALLPLCDLHRRAWGQSAQFPLRVLSSILLLHEGTIRRIVAVLLDDICHQDKPEALLRRVFDRCVSLDGRIERAPLEPVGRGFRMGRNRYASADELVDHVLLPIKIAASPDLLLSEAGELPEQMPMMADPLIMLLEAVLNTHYPDVEEPPRQATRPCNPHLHWGGPAMAGYQPQIRGYFSEHARHLRKLFRPIMRELPEIDPVFFILLPAGVFNLCPHESSPSDVALVNDLLVAVCNQTEGLLGRPAEMSRCIEDVVQQWHQKATSELSSYLLGRFSPIRGTVNSLPEPIEGGLALLASLRNLTLQQASMTMGAIRRLSWPMPC